MFYTKSLFTLAVYFLFLKRENIYWRSIVHNIGNKKSNKHNLEKVLVMTHENCDLCHFISEGFYVLHTSLPIVLNPYRSIFLL